MHSIWCHNGGEAADGEILVVGAGCSVEWRAYKEHDPKPDGAVWAGKTKTDGAHGVCVGRNQRGVWGKINMYEGENTLHNLWIHGHLTSWKEGEILVVGPR